MSKIKRMITVNVPINRCNFKCHYCYLSQRDEPAPTDKDNYLYDAKHIRKAFSQKRLGGVCVINLCGNGETLIQKEIIDITRELLEEGHFVEIVTNGVLTNRINQLLEFDKTLLGRLAFKFSLHYDELVRQNLVKTYFNNANNLRNAGCSVYLELCASDEFLPVKKEIYDVCVKEYGAPPHLTIVRDDMQPHIPIITKLSDEDYVKEWSDFKCEMFDYKLTTYYKKQTEFCYAGDWTLYVNLRDGSASQCYCSYKSFNVFENIDKEIDFCAIGNNCSLSHCYNSHMFLTWGNIPSVLSPTYKDMRDRIRPDGTHWLSDEVLELFSSQLKESNEEYSSIKKAKTNFVIKSKIFFKNTIIGFPLKVYRYLKYKTKSIIQSKTVYNKAKKQFLLDLERTKYATTRYWFIGTPNYANIGDQAIVYAEKQLLTDIGLKENIVDVNFIVYNKNPQKIYNMVNQNDVVIIDGGGNMGSLWQDEENKMQDIIKNLPNNKIIVFPKTAFYEDSGNNITLEKEKQIYNSHKNLFIFAREEKTYDILKKHFTCNIGLVPDIVLYLHDKINIDKPRKNEVAFCIRKDKESIIKPSELNKIKQVINKNNLQITYIDTVVPDVDLFLNREKTVNDLLASFAGNKLIVTDRLHGMIFSVLTKTPCVAFDNLSKKASGVYKWLKNCEYVYFLNTNEEVDGDRVQKLLDKNFSLDINDFDFSLIEKALKGEN